VSTQSNPLSADFEADITSGFAPLTVIFDDLSTGSITSWEWNFGNGETSTLQNPTVTYSVAGSYTISLTVSDGTYQITETKEDYVEVYSSIFNDGFEDYDDFSINFSPWTNIDVDGSSTYGISGYSWQNANDSQAFIIFNPASTSPVLTDADAHSGSKYAACFSSADPTYLNNDWLITPQISLNDSYVLSFWAKSYTDQYGLERFNVGISTTGTNTSDFTIISTSPYEQAPTTWTEYSFDLSSYLGQDVYIAIQCVSADAFFLMIDDFVIGDSFNRSISNPVASQVNGKNKKEIK
jgi:PKD repeat protein